MTLLELVAATLEIDEGEGELRVSFSDGRLRRWETSDVRNGAHDLRRFDARARGLLDALSA